MNKVLITTDSTCDLSKELLERFSVVTIPLHVNFEEESYDDGVNISLGEVYQRVERTGVLPKTSAVSMGEFYEFFQKYMDEGYDIFYTGISSQMSSTYQSAVLVSEQFEKGRICVVDSKNLSTGIGLLVLKACDLRDQGLSAQAIATKIEGIVPKVKSQFVIETLEYLHKGGRCSSVTRFFGTMLRMKPMIVVRDGAMSVGRKTIGSMKKAMNVMVQLFLDDLKDIDPDYVFITHALADDNCLYIKEKLKEVIGIKELFETVAGCVIGSHCGAGTIGILYILKDKIVEKEVNEE